MSDTGPTRSRTPLLLFFAIAIAAVATFFAIRHFNNEGEEPEPGVDLARVAELRNLGLAWL